MRRCGSAAVLGVVGLVVLGACAPQPPEAVAPSDTAPAPLERPSADALFDAITEGEELGGDEETVARCLADALVDDDRISDETLQAIADEDDDYVNDPSDLPDGEDEALADIFTECSDLEVEG